MTDQEAEEQRKKVIMEHVIREWAALEIRRILGECIAGTGLSDQGFARLVRVLRMADELLGEKQ